MIRGLVLAGMLCIPSAAYAGDTPRPGRADARIRTVDYDPDEVYRVTGVFRTATQVLFGEGETILHVALGDTVAWEVAPAANILFLKPREKAGPTNLIVTTKQGQLVVAPASDTGFTAKASLALFDRLVWTPPSFADGRIYARDSYGGIAAGDASRSACSSCRSRSWR